MEHKELKEIGWKEWLADESPQGFTIGQLELLRSAYDYGWSCAYGLESNDKYQREWTGEFNQLKKTLLDKGVLK